MKVIIFGATGMVGAGALREALSSDNVEAVLSVGRRSCGVQHPKLRELNLPDLFDFSAVENQLRGYDACIWTIGVSSLGLDEVEYTRITEELTLLWARALLRLNPKFSFCYCSGGGADGPGMWARVRRRVEERLKAMPFQASGSVRPGFIRPGRGIRAANRMQRVINMIMAPVLLFTPLLVRVMPFLFTTSEILGKAMLRVVEEPQKRFILEMRDINRIGRLALAA